MEKLTSKIDDYGIGHWWSAMIKMVSERQQCKGSLVRDGGSMILLVLLHAHTSGERMKI